MQIRTLEAGRGRSGTKRTRDVCSWPRADTAEAVGGSQLLTQSRSPVYDARQTLRRSLRGLEDVVAVHRPAGLVVQPRRGQRKGRSSDENPPRAVDRQSTPLVPVCTCASDSRIIHPRILQAVAADFTSSSEHIAFPLAPAPWS
jgi:hypothetical protein